MLITCLCGSEIVLLIYQGLSLPDSLDIVGQTIFYNCKFYKNNTKFAIFEFFYKMASTIKFMLKCPAGLDTCVFVYIVIAMSD